jgi:L-fuconolactonase
MNRKEFIRSSAIVTTGALAGLSALDVSAARPLPIIDTHQHLWDVNQNQGWSKSPLGRNFDENDYRDAIEGLNVLKSVYVEVGVPQNRKHAEALYAIKICQDKANPTAAAVISANPNDTNFKTYLSQFEGSPYIKAVRHFFQSEAEFTKKEVVDNIRALGDMNLMFEFSIPTRWLPAMTELIKLAPGTEFVVNHGGNVDPRAFFKKEDLKGEKPDHDANEWIKDMKAIAKPSNVCLKISGMATRAMNHTLTRENLKPAIDHCLDIFGPNRVMFASDWPVCLRKIEFNAWVNLFKETVSDRPYREQKKLFYDNAAKFYKI